MPADDGLEHRGLPALIRRCRHAYSRLMRRQHDPSLIGLMGSHLTNSDIKSIIIELRGADTRNPQVVADAIEIVTHRRASPADVNRIRIALADL